VAKIKIGSRVWVLDTSETPYRILPGEVTSVDDETYVYVKFDDGSRGCFEADDSVFETEDEAWEQVAYCIEVRKQMLEPYEDLLRRRPAYG
jgi:hypothetical protein